MVFINEMKFLLYSINKKVALFIAAFLFRAQKYKF